MNEIYWITRLGALSDLCEWVIGLSGVFLSGSLLFFPIIENYMEENDGKYWPKFWRIFRNVSIVCVLAIVCKVFIPTQKELLFIYGVGGTIDYVKNNDKAKELPDKAVMALSKYLDEEGKEESQ